MNPLKAEQERLGRTDGEMATDLSALLGKPISEQGYRLHSSRKTAPKAWAEVLGLDASPPAPEEWEPPAADTGGATEREAGAPPTAPHGAQTTTLQTATEYGFAKQRLVEAYTFIGAGASMVTHNDGYGAVTKVYAPNLADAWIAAAKTNENVARIVKFMESGGPVGELVVSHIILVLGFVYVSGKGPDLDAIYGKHFHGYRVAAVGGRIADEAARVANNGSDPQGATHTVGDATS